MLPFEKKINEWVNRNMVYIALVFVVASAAWMRMGGRNYTGSDYHFSLYDLPGSCGSLLYRSIAGFLMRRPDSAITALKLIAYAGDFAVALLALMLLRRKEQKIGDLRTFFVITACLLSPVSLLYGVSGMKIDSVCMSLLLTAILLFRKGLVLPAVPVLALAGFLSPAYWPIVVAFLSYHTAGQRRKGQFNSKTALAAALLGLCLILSFFLENSGDGRYFWGKLFVIDPSTGENYASFGQWLGGMCRIYGYAAATGSLLSALKHRRMRIPALILQVLVLMYVGWQQTFFFAL